MQASVSREWNLPGHFILFHVIIAWAVSGQGTRATWNKFNTLESMGFIDLGQWTYPKDAQNDDGRCGHVFLTLRFYIDRIATSETAYDLLREIKNRALPLRTHHQNWPFAVVQRTKGEDPSLHLHGAGRSCSSSRSTTARGGGCWLPRAPLL